MRQRHSCYRLRYIHFFFTCLHLNKSSEELSLNKTESNMRLYNCPQISQNASLRNHRERVRGTVPSQQTLRDSEQQKDTDVKTPNTLLNPVLAPDIHQSLHRELLFCYRRGLLPKKKSELQSVLDKLRETRTPPQTDLDRHLHYRRIRMGALERVEEKRRRQIEPEFVQVKGALKHIPGFCLYLSSQKI